MSDVNSEVVDQSRSWLDRSKEKWKWRCVSGKRVRAWRTILVGTVHEAYNLLKLDKGNIGLEIYLKAIVEVKKRLPCFCRCVELFA